MEVEERSVMLIIYRAPRHRGGLLFHMSVSSKSAVPSLT